MFIRLGKKDYILAEHQKVGYLPHNECRLFQAIYNLICNGIYYCLYKLALNEALKSQRIPSSSNKLFTLSYFPCILLHYPNF